MIPKKLHQIWVGSPLPERLERFAEMWLRAHKAWDYRLWTDDDVKKLVNQRLYDNAETIAPGREGQFRSDILRYEILAKYGGVYVDLDMECLKPIDGLLNCPAFVAWEQPNRWVNNAIMGSIARHPFVVDLVNGLARNVRLNRGQRPNMLSGPQYVTPRLRRDVVVYPKEHFYPYLWNELDRSVERFPDAYAVHHWYNSRKRRGIPLATVNR